jgi:tRNA A37 methylthiotransferase MiaB
VRAELTYIGERIPKNIKALFISDLNFGMYRRDAEIADAIAAIRQECDYPHYIDTTTGKNSRARVIRNVEKLSGALALTMSVQSMTEEVLVNIKRDNMRLGDFLALKPAMQRAGLPATAEVILGLPGETRSSHLDSLDQLLTSEIDNVFSYTLMLLNGSELNTPEQREKWGLCEQIQSYPP